MKQIATVAERIEILFYSHLHAMRRQGFRPAMAVAVVVAVATAVAVAVATTVAVAVEDLCSLHQLPVAPVARQVVLSQFVRPPPPQSSPPGPPLGLDPSCAVGWGRGNS